MLQVMCARNFMVAVAASAAIALGALGQQGGTPQVYVYATYFMADGRTFGSIEELRNYLLAAPNDFFSIFIADCAGKDHVEELQRMMTKVISERAKQRNQDNFVYQFGVGSPPGCARALK